MKKTLLLLTILTLFQNISFSQDQKKMDSLKTALNNSGQDTTRLKIYFALGDECNVKDNLLYAQPAMELADKLIANSKNETERKMLIKQKIHIYDYFTSYYNEKGEMAKVLDYLKKGLEQNEKLNDIYGISSFSFQIGILYGDVGDTTQALDYLQRGLKVLNGTGETWQIAKRISIMATFYAKIHNYNKAIEYYNKSISMWEHKGTRISLYYQLGAAYSANGDFKKAMESFQKSLLLAEEEKQNFAIVAALRFSGTVYRQQNDISNAIDYHQRALKLSEKDTITEEIGLNCGELAKDYVQQKKYKEALPYSTRYLEIMKGTGFIDENILNATQLAAKVDSLNGNYKDAYTHYQQYIILRTKLNSEDVHQEAIKEKFQREYEKQKTIDEAEQSKKDEFAKAESKKQKLIILFVALGLLLVLIFAGFIFRSLRITNKQKDIIEEKNREITDSIEYALRIQTAILPPQKIVKQYLENSFILYKPKDIVAGDFYWMETVNDLVLFAACDCTGHGVPGAMVSVVCHNALNRAVREFELTQPAAILDKTAEIVIENFSKSEEDIKDGMDISLCSYNVKTKTIQWAGANNPLWLLQNGELIETKADKQPIGMNEDSKPFTNHTFTLNNGDTIYLFTDGFADQFGGDTGQKKLTKKHFKDLILSVQNKSLQEQGIALDKFITEYRKQIEQIDDILVMGVKV